MTKFTFATAVAAILVLGVATGANAAVRKHDPRNLETKPSGTPCAVAEYVGPDSYCFLGAEAGPVMSKGRAVRAY